MRQWRGKRRLWVARPGAWIALISLAAVALVGGYWFSQRGRPPPRRGVAVNSALGNGDQGGYKQVLKPRAFVFPADHGPHPRYRTEWWYFTGNLVSAAGRRFGYELTLFRIALAPKPPRSHSPWATNQLYVAHFALTDVAGGRFHDAQRLARGGELGVAGAHAEPFHVWVDSWQVHSSGTGADFPWQLHAKADGVAVNLALRGVTPVIPQGERGFSRKSAGRGHASYYYSIPRLKTRGSVRLHGETVQVRGLSWLDREWSSGALSQQQTGWDWFALQLDNGTDVMFYRLRERGGRTDPHSAGSLITSDGHRRALGATDAVLSPRRWWRNARGTRYPVAWRLALPKYHCRLRIKPLLDDQELDTFVRYWEGAVAVHGRCQGAPVSGHGYLELTGYASNEPAKPGR